MRIFGMAPPSPNTLCSGLVSASTIDVVLRVPARFVRSGPTSPPLPFTTWQFTHSPLPRKTCSPSAASPAAGASIAVLDRVEDLRVARLRVPPSRHAERRSHLAAGTVGAVATRADAVVDLPPFVDALRAE